ncbi:MAG: enoyl-CoA hydratase/isomerase family protein, partial [Candidatus Limnocylindria bacterium]
MTDTAGRVPETIREERDDGVLTITLARPESLNAINATMRRELLASLKAAARDEAVRCIVLTGEGRGFCSGADLRGGAAEQDFRRVLTDEYNPLIVAIRSIEKPVIAAVNGVAAGAGVSLAVACDLVYAAEHSRFIEAFSRVGLVPDTGSTISLVRTLGRYRAAELIFTADPLSAPDAAAAGLVNRVVPPEDLLSTVNEIARRLAGGPTRALGLAKRAINHAETAGLEESLAYEAALQS